jgi:hypothetical protein
VAVETSSEVETLPISTANYNVPNDHRKTECDFRQRLKTRHFCKIKKIPPDTILKPEKEDTSKPGHMVTLGVKLQIHTFLTSALDGG